MCVASFTSSHFLCFLHLKSFYGKMSEQWEKVCAFGKGWGKWWEIFLPPNKVKFSVIFFVTESFSLRYKMRGQRFKDDDIALQSVWTFGYRKDIFLRLCGYKIRCPIVRSASTGMAVMSKHNPMVVLHFWPYLIIK